MSGMFKARRFCMSSNLSPLIIHFWRFPLFSASYCVPLPSEQWPDSISYLWYWDMNRIDIDKRLWLSEALTHLNWNSNRNWQKINGENGCSHIKLLKILLQLWKKLVVWIDDNCFLCYFIGSVRGPSLTKSQLVFFGRPTFYEPHS